MEYVSGQSGEGQYRAVGIQGDRWVHLHCVPHLFMFIYLLEGGVVQEVRGKRGMIENVCVSVGEPYGNNWVGEWAYLYSLAKNQSNTGTFSFLPEPSAKFSSWELGAVRISPSTYQDGTWCVNTFPAVHTASWFSEE